MEHAISLPMRSMLPAHLLYAAPALVGCLHALRQVGRARAFSEQAGISGGAAQGPPPPPPPQQPAAPGLEGLYRWAQAGG